MEDIGDFIKNNKDMIHDIEPDEGHFQRFEEKLRIQKRRNKIVVFRRVAGIAAICLILISSSIFIFDRFIDREPVNINLGEINPFMQKVEFYYTSQINQASMGIDSLSEDAQEEIRQMIKDELIKMDSVYLGLQDKLRINPGDDHVVDALITYYQTKLNMMNSFLNTLQEIKQSKQLKNTTNENTLL